MEHKQHRWQRWSMIKQVWNDMLEYGDFDEYGSPRSKPLLLKGRKPEHIPRHMTYFT